MLSSPHWFVFIYSESHALRAGVLLSDVNLNVLLKMKTEWETLSPKQNCPLYPISGRTSAAGCWVGARRTGLLKIQNQPEYLLRKWV